MLSCIYEGQVSHKRFVPVKHQFRYRLIMVYLDLADLPELTAGWGLISPRLLGLASFLRSDHLKEMNGDLDPAIRELVKRETGRSLNGPIRLLTQLRYCGYYFSPLNLYYCFDESGEYLEAVVAEVNNTPWREQHCYVLWDGNRVASGNRPRYRHDKSFHVSPFMGMDIDYRWMLSVPGPSLDVSILNTQKGDPYFHARLVMKRHMLNRRNLAWALGRYPLMTVRVMVAIYYQAFRLWMKKVPFVPHPSKTSQDGVVS